MQGKEEIIDTVILETQIWSILNSHAVKGSFLATCKI